MPCTEIMSEDFFLTLLTKCHGYTTAQSKATTSSAALQHGSFQEGKQVEGSIANLAVSSRRSF